MKVDNEEIMLVISNLIIEVIEKNTPYQWIQTVEPFPHPYKYDKISYDYSGETIPMIKEEFQKMAKDLDKDQWYTSKLHKLLDSVYIDEWVASYISNLGKSWISYFELLEDKFNEWKYDNFQLYDEDGNELDEDLEMELDDIFYDFIKNTSHELYYKKILKKL